MRSRPTRLILCGLATIAGLIPADGHSSDRTTLVANRNDVSFFVHAAGQRYAVDIMSPLAQESEIFRWELDSNRLRQALAAKFDLRTREINFSEFCASIPASQAQKEVRTCKKLATIRAGETYRFYFYPSDQAADKARNIYIIDSECVIIGSENQALC